MRYNAYLFSIFILFVAGCTGQINKQTVQRDSMVESSLSAALTASEQFYLGDWPEKQWWTQFNDPQLTELIETALQTSPTLQRAFYQMQSAEQQAKKIRSFLFPQLDVEAMENWEYFSKNGFVRDFYPVTPPMQVPPTVNQLDLSLNLNYEIDFWGKNKKRFHAALGEAKAQMAERAQAQLTLCTAIAFAYFTFQTKARELHTNEQILQLVKEKQSLRSDRTYCGIDNAVPLLDVDESLYAIKQEISRLNKEMIVDVYVLKELLGEGPDSPREIVPGQISYPSRISLPQNIGLDLLSHRPDLVAGLWRVESASQNIGVAKTEFYPNVNLAAFGGLESLSFANFLSWDSKTGAISPAIHLPLFTGGRLKANLQEKVAEYHQAVFAYNETLLRAAREVVSEIASIRSIQERTQLQQTLLRSVKAKIDINSNRHQNGIETQLTLLSTKENYLVQQLTEIHLDESKLFSLIRLIKSLGGGYEEIHLPPQATAGAP